MFEASFLLGLKHLLINIVLPLIPGILFLWIFFGKKFSGMLLYILSWFLGVGVIAFSMFNLQFVHFGIGVGEYLLILWILLAVFVGKLLYKKLSFKTYISTLKIKNIFSDIRHSFDHLSNIEKIFTWIIAILWLGFLVITFIRSTHFPTYADDSFGNWNGPAYNIYTDGGVKLFGEKAEILGRGRLGYPIYIPIYKAVVSDAAGDFNDIYINIWQWLVFFGMILFVFTITFAKTKNIFYSLLPIWLIVSLPLVFFHVGEWYMELASAAYSLLAIWALWKFLEEYEYAYISLALLSWFILSYVKNDGFVIYLPGILLAFVIVLLTKKTLVKVIQSFFKDTYNILISAFFFVFFFLPFLIIKNYYHLGFNQAAWAESWIGVTSTVHREIFNVFPGIFMQMDNYNSILIILVLLAWLVIKKWKHLTDSSKFLLYAPIFVLVLLLLVFLLTENYLFALNQTTINRVFTIVFVLLFSFSWYLFAEKWSD